MEDLARNWKETTEELERNWKGGAGNEFGGRTGMKNWKDTAKELGRNLEEIGGRAPTELVRNWEARSVS